MYFLFYQWGWSSPASSFIMYLCDSDLCYRRQAVDGQLYRAPATQPDTGQSQPDKFKVSDMPTLFGRVFSMCFRIWHKKPDLLQRTQTIWFHIGLSLVYKCLISQDDYFFSVVGHYVIL